jgi:hypothetical protein
LGFRLVAIRVPLLLGPWMLHVVHGAILTVCPHAV